MSSPKVLTINDLPNEVLLVIFDFAATPPPPNSTTRNFRRVVSLTHVSRRWMVTLLGDGQSWSNVHIYGQDIDMLDTQIRRCQQASLRVWVEVPFWSTLKSTHFSQSKKNIEKAANLVRKRRGQVVRLQVRMSCRFFHKLLGNEWPNLKKLVFVDDCSLGSNLHGVVDGGSLPTLKFLSIDGGYGWPVNIATRLTTLRLQGPTNLDLTTFAKFLRRNSSLESLELTGLIIGGSQSYHRGETPIKLPHLNELLVRNATLGCALDLLNLPSLQRLNVSSCARQNPWSDSHWSRLCSQLPITSLEAHYRSSLHQEITVSGSGESGAHSFRFTEFSPTTLGPALFKSLSTTPLSFVTSFTLVKGMPEARVSSLTAAIHGLLKKLPQVEHMNLCPSGLALAVLRRLSDHSELCPGLRELEVMVTAETCEAAVELVAKVVEGRASCGNGRKMRRVGCFHPTALQRSEEMGVQVACDKFWKKFGLERYVSGE